MNLSEFTYLLHKPNAINNQQINDLETILKEYPYFQSARSLHLKGLFNQDNFKYNSALKVTATYTTDRNVLFNFITSPEFLSLQKDEFESKEKKIKEIEVTEVLTIIEKDSIEETPAITKVEESIQSSIEIATKTKIQENTYTFNTENTLEKSIISSIKEAFSEVEEIQEEALELEKPEKKSWLEDTLEIEKPLHFEKNETHSFQEWLQLSKIQPINRNEGVEIEKASQLNLEAKIDLIDKFIETNPKISPPKEDIPAPSFTLKKEDTSYLMTETLAKIYLEQKKYSKAIQAYEILILKYPEKSSLFANRILEIKEIQQNNNK